MEDFEEKRLVTETLRSNTTAFLALIALMTTSVVGQAPSPRPLHPLSVADDDKDVEDANHYHKVDVRDTAPKATVGAERSRLLDNPPPPPPPDADDVEAAPSRLRDHPPPPPPAAADDVGAERSRLRYHPPPPPGSSSIILNWPKIILESCFAASAQLVVGEGGKDGPHSVSECCYSLAILLAVVALVVGKMMARKLPRVAAAVERGGIVMGGAAFLLSIAAPFHPYLKGAIWGIYAAFSLLFFIILQAADLEL